MLCTILGVFKASKARIHIQGSLRSFGNTHYLFFKILFQVQIFKCTSQPNRCLGKEGV